MNITNYLDQIVLWAGVALSAGFGIFTTIMGLKKLINQIKEFFKLLKQTKTDYEQGQEDLENTAIKLVEAMDTIDGLKQQAKDYAENAEQKFDDIKAELAETRTENSLVKSALYCLALNNKYMVNNGSANEMREILGIKTSEVQSDEAAN